MGVVSLMRRLLGALFGCLLAVCVLAVAAGFPMATPVSAAPAPAVRAADFLKRELVRLGYTFPAMTPGTSDGGLVADALIGLHAAGQTGGEFTKATQKLRETSFSANIRTSGLIAKYLLVAVKAGVDPTAWGKDSAGQPVNLVQRLAETLDANGRYRNITSDPYDPARDTSNVFSQALALIAVNTHKPGADNRAAVDYLVRQQCPSGGFRPAPPPTNPNSACASNDPLVNVDYTAMAVWALAETGADRASLAKGLAWLRGNQRPDSGFVAEGAVNANSTGLAALALAKAGDTTNAGRAAGWLVSVQLPATPAVPTMIGAIAYNAEKYLEIRRNPAEFWGSPANQDQLRRSTAQAVLGLAAVNATHVPPPPREPTQKSNNQKTSSPSRQPDRNDPDSDTAGPGGIPPGPGDDITPTTTLPTPQSGVTPVAYPAGASPPHRASDVARGGDDFLDFLRGPGGIASSIALGFVIAGFGYWLLTRRTGLTKTGLLKTGLPKPGILSAGAHKTGSRNAGVHKAGVHKAGVRGNRKRGGGVSP